MTVVDPCAALSSRRRRSAALAPPCRDARRRSTTRGGPPPRPGGSARSSGVRRDGAVAPPPLPDVVVRVWRVAVALHFAPPSLTCANAEIARRHSRKLVDGGGSGVTWRNRVQPSGSRRVEEVEVADRCSSGTHTPRLDEKGRLFLPAKFRERLAGGLVVTRGQERCLFVYPMDEFDRLADQMQPGPGDAARWPATTCASSSPAPTDEIPDKQGRFTIPAALRAYAGLDRECTVIGAGTASRSGTARPGTPTSPRQPSRASPTRSRGGGPGPVLTRRRTAPAPPSTDDHRRRPPADRPDCRPPAARLPTTTSPVPGADRMGTSRQVDRTHAGPAPEHRTAPPQHHPSPEDAAMSEPRRRRRHGTSPCCATAIVELLAPALAAPGAVCVDATLGMGGHAEALLERLPGAPGSSASTATSEALAPVGRAAGAASATGSVLVHAVYDEHRRDVARRARPARPCDGILFDLGVSLAAARRGRPRLRLPRSTPRSTCGWTSRPASPRPTSSTPTAADDLARILRDYGEERFARPDRLGRRARARAASRSPRPAGSSSCCAASSRRPRSAAAATRPSAPSRPCASRSTASSRCWQRAVPAAIDVLAVGGRIAVLSYHSLEDRITKQAFAAGAHSQHPARAAGRAARARRIPAPAHPRRRGARRRRSAANPRAASARCAPPNACRHRTEPPHEPARPGPAAAAHQRPPRRADPAPAQGRGPPQRAGQRRCSSPCASLLLLAGFVGLLHAQHRPGQGLVHAARPAARVRPAQPTRQDDLQEQIDGAPAPGPLAAAGPGTRAWCRRRPRRSSACPTARCSAWRRRPQDDSTFRVVTEPEAPAAAAPSATTPSPSASHARRARDRDAQAAAPRRRTSRRPATTTTPGDRRQADRAADRGTHALTDPHAPHDRPRRPTERRRDPAQDATALGARATGVGRRRAARRPARGAPAPGRRRKPDRRARRARPGRPAAGSGHRRARRRPRRRARPTGARARHGRPADPPGTGSGADQRRRRAPAAARPRPRRRSRGPAAAAARADAARPRVGGTPARPTRAAGCAS